MAGTVNRDGSRSITLRSLIVALFTVVVSINSMLVYLAIQTQEADRARLVAEKVAVQIAGLSVEERYRIQELIATAANRWNVVVTVSGEANTYYVAGHFDRSYLITPTSHMVGSESGPTVRVQSVPDTPVRAALNANLLTGVLIWILALVYAIVEFSYRQSNRTLRELLRALDGTEDTPRTPAAAGRKSRHRFRWPYRMIERRIQTISQELVQTRMENRIERARIRRRSEEQEETAKRLAVDAHDLRAPLANISTYARAVYDGLWSPGGGRGRDTHTHLQGILDACKAMEMVVDQRLAQRKQAAKSVNVARVIEHVVRIHQRTAMPKGVTIRLWIHRDLPRRMRVGEKSLWQGVSNLLSNAIKHSPQGSVVHVRVAPHPSEAEGWMVDVMDNGPGVPEGWEERVFGEGVQIGAGDGRCAPVTDSGGIGLGLGAARAFARFELGDARVMRGPHLGTGAWFRWEWRDLRIPNAGPVAPKRTVLVDVPGNPELEQTLIAHVQRLTEVLVITPRERRHTGLVDLRVTSEHDSEGSGDEPCLILAEHPFHMDLRRQTVLAHWVTLDELETFLGLRPGINMIEVNAPLEGQGILLVDDQPQNNKALAVLLLSCFPELTKNRILEANSAEESRCIIHEQPGKIGAAIVDYQMPIENGMELVSWIGSEYPDIACAVITGDHRPEVRRKAFAHGAQKVFGRPVDELELKKWLHPIASGKVKRETIRSKQEGGWENQDSSDDKEERARERNEGIRRLLANAKDSIVNADRDELLRVLHTARGSCAMLGMEDYARLFGAIEDLARSGAHLKTLQSKLENVGEVSDKSGDYGHR